jgi:hypothetical protein
VTTAEAVRQEERDAARRHREGLRLARLAQRAREEAARVERAERRRAARTALTALQPTVRTAQREYTVALTDAVRPRRGESREQVDARFDLADRRMSALQDLTRRVRRLQAEARS